MTPRAPQHGRIWFREGSSTLRYPCHRLLQVGMQGVRGGASVCMSAKSMARLTDGISPLPCIPAHLLCDHSGYLIQSSSRLSGPMRQHGRERGEAQSGPPNPAGQ